MNKGPAVRNISPVEAALPSQNVPPKLVQSIQDLFLSFLGSLCHRKNTEKFRETELFLLPAA